MVSECPVPIPLQSSNSIWVGSNAASLFTKVLKCNINVFSGALSHAVWLDKLRLAEVTKKVGSHWQYMGHYLNGKSFLFPEEALFLIETVSTL